MLRYALPVAAVLASPALAGAFVFTGTFDNTNPPAAAGGRCPGLTVNIGNHAPFYATGTSNLGSFTAVQSHCLAGGPPVAPGAANVPYTDGRFVYTFAGGASLSGTYAGLLSNGGAFGVVDNVQNFTVTGGSGRYAGATGSFLGTGEIRFGGGPPAAMLTISDGRLAAPGVPEPATWTTLVTGFAVAGIVLRYRRRTAAVAA